MVIVIFMVMAVDALLLYATGRLLRGRFCLWRYLLSVVFSGVFAVLGLYKDISFFGSFIWQIIMNLIIGTFAFGIQKESLYRVVLFSLLRLSVGGAVGRENIVSVLLGTAGIGFACMVMDRGEKYIPVELNYRGKTCRITALRDTGNNLRDPITGKGVLVVDANVACSLTGLAPLALQDPVNSLKALPGSRLIPYQSVGNTGFLLALQITNAKVGNRQTSLLVALSPNLLSKHYQALSGGSL